jgi:hypothetical protein
VSSPLESALFGRLIDHAPMFPPARLPLADALEDHRRAREGPQGWMVRRFVVPAAALPALDGEQLPLSVVVDGGGELDDPRIESVEVPPGRPVPPFRGEVYVEGGDSEGRTLVKVRCGPEPPPLAELAGLIRSCREQSVPFKATAGLHHAIRQDGQHGFVNLLAAAIFGDEEAALAEKQAAAFGVADDAFRWRDRTASVDDVRRGRELFVAFGSCSFSEPVDDLRSLGLLSG